MAFTFNKEHSMRARILAKNHPYPDETILPEVWVYWPRTKKGVKYMQAYNYMTGEIKTTNEEDADASDGYNAWVSYHSFNAYPFCIGTGCYQKTENAIVTTPRGYIYSYYAWYHEEFDCLELGYISFKADRQIDKVHKWEVDSRCYIFKNDPIAYDFKGDRFFSEYDDGRYYNKTFIKWVKDAPGDVNLSYGNEVKKYMQIECRNGYSTTWYPYNLSEELKKVAPRKESSRKLTINELQLEEIDLQKFSKDHPVESIAIQYKRYDETWGEDIVHKDNIMKFELINDEYCVFRFFARYWNSPTIINEKIRLFVDSKGKVTVMEKQGNNWNISSMTVDKIPIKFVSVGFDNIYKFDRLKYISKIMEENKIKETHYDREYKQKDCRLQCMVGLLRHPVIEMLYKSGYPVLALYLYNNGKITSDLKFYFNAKESKKPLFAMLNTNKFVLKWLENYLIRMEKERPYEYSRPSIPNYIIPYATEVAGCELKFCNEQTVNEILNGMEKILKGNNADYRQLVSSTEANCYGRWWIDRKRPRWPVRELSQEERNRMMQIFRIQEKDTSGTFIRTLMDTMRTLSNIGQENRPDVNLNHITDPNQLIRIHDLLIEIKAREDAERKALYDMEEKQRQEEQKKKCAKLYEKRVEKYEYSDDTYMIIVPKDPLDLAKEGAALHHCLGSYQQSYAFGDTDIVFLRYKANPDVHYCSIEIKNNNVIQAHKNYNAWISSDDEGVKAARFLYKYFKSRGINCEHRILTNRATGYGASSSNVPWEEIIKEVD